MKANNRIKKVCFTEILLCLASLAAPFIWMKIGPGGYAYYGPNVPDIYILGGYITGKDTSWWGINLAYKFQWICILIFAGLSFLCYRKPDNRRIILTAGFFQIVFLILFPVWMRMYVSGVYNNSDNADLTVYPHVGWLLYILMWILVVWKLIKTRRDMA